MALEDEIDDEGVESVEASNSGKSYYVFVTRACKQCDILLVELNIPLNLSQYSGIMRPICPLT